jgi:hypothetical protein
MRKSGSEFPALRDELAALEEEIGRLKTPTCNPASSRRQGRKPLQRTRRKCWLTT